MLYSLIERWEQVKHGQGQVILLSGEAGIGKSRLVQVIKDHVSEGPHTRIECRSSSYFTNSALDPITDFLQRTCDSRQMIHLKRGWRSLHKIWATIGFEIMSDMDRERKLLLKEITKNATEAAKAFWSTYKPQ